MRFLMVTVILAIGLWPSAALADSATVTDEVGDIIVGPEISDITAATIDFSAKRLSISVTHASWRSQWRRYRSATGGRIRFDKGPIFVIVSNVNGRRSQLYTLKGFRNCPPNKKCVLPCKGWRYAIDEAALSTGVSVPLRCFGLAERPKRVRVRPFHVIPLIGQQPVVDPVAMTPWIVRSGTRSG